MENNKYSILIADDNKIDIDLLREGISAEDRSLFCVYSGREVLDYVGENAVDLILLDVMMPDLDGYQVCEQLKQNPMTKRIPVIFLTSLTDTNDVAKGLEMGAVDYIVKPYNMVEINARLKNHLMLQKGHERSIQLLKGFANSVSDTAIMSNESGEVIDVFGNYQHYFPQVDFNKKTQKLSDILPAALYKQFSIAMETAYRTHEVFEFETEASLGKEKMVLQITVSPIDFSDKISIKIANVTNRRSAERKVDLTYEYQKRSQFFNSVLKGAYTGEQQSQLLSVYGIENQKPMICYVIATSLCSPNAAGESIRAGIGEWLIEKGYGWVWNSMFGIGLLMQYPNKMTEIDRIADVMKGNMEMRFPDLRVHIGISSTELSGGNFHQLYYDALGAVFMAINEQKDFVVAQYGNGALNELMVHLMEHMDVERFINQTLGKIQRNDLKNGSDLLRTLEQLIRMPSIRLAAANLFVHPNTVLWRKQKIEETLAVSLDDIDARTQINLAFKLLRIHDFIRNAGEEFSDL